MDDSPKGVDSLNGWETSASTEAFLSIFKPHQVHLPVPVEKRDQQRQENHYSPFWFTRDLLSCTADK